MNQNLCVPIVKAPIVGYYKVEYVVFWDGKDYKFSVDNISLEQCQQSEPINVPDYSPQINFFIILCVVYVFALWIKLMKNK